MNGMMGTMMGGMMWMMMLGVLVLVLLLIAGIVVVVRLLAGRTGRGTGEATRILDERYARGEIDREDYEERRDIIRSGR